MKCVSPHVTQQMLDDDENGTWFCPFCTAFATFIHYTQVEYLGDEWEDMNHCHRGQKFYLHDRNQSSPNDDDMSTASWSEAEDMFPEAETEIHVAENWKAGVRDDATDKFLYSLLGLPTKSPNAAFLGVEDHFSLYSNDSSDESFTCSHNNDGDSIIEASTSDEEAAVDWKIEKSEIDAMSSSSSLSYVDETGEEKKSASFCVNRSTKRKRSIATSNDVGKLDAANIIEGRRRRTKVDYRR